MQRAYPGIRRDMAAVQSASAERRPDLTTLPDARAVVEALLQHSLGLSPDLSALAPTTQEVIARAVGMLAAVEGEEARVGDAAALTGELYALIDEGLSDPGRQMAPPPEQGPEDPDAPPEGDGAPPPPPSPDGDGI
jgi:hypothetical protein